ncbi:MULTISPECIES: hypothetical protein [Actinomadura]|uniref:Mce-associated membrane protein n=1 Tax=Actinomadura yumaensis TaxID=111807 RepID=A0ABW2CPS8_9ACTN|nr:hypothetical protein [Actinomadura sp. J1-007]MWK36500.1 hypothetical protein [Actinomadura sp. J1-007]
MTNAAALRKAVWTPKWVRPAGYVVLAAATVFLCTSLWSLIQSGRGADNDLASARDDLSRTAVRQVTMLNTIDPKRADLDLAHWLEVATGPFHDALKRDMPTAQAKFAKQTAPSRGQVTALAITEFDRAGGNATVITSVRVFTGTGDQASEQRKRYQVGMQRVNGAWKVATLNSLSPAGPPAGGSRP